MLNKILAALWLIYSGFLFVAILLFIFSDSTSATAMLIAHLFIIVAHYGYTLARKITRWALNTLFTSEDLTND